MKNRPREDRSDIIDEEETSSGDPAGAGRERVSICSGHPAGEWPGAVRAVHGGQSLIKNTFHAGELLTNSATLPAGTDDRPQQVPAPILTPNAR